MKEDDIPSAIKQLKLNYAFRNYAVKPTDCVTVKDDYDLLIIDDDYKKCCRFIDEPNLSTKGFKITNKNKHEIVLLAIDHKLINNRKGGIADCAVFNDKLFVFAEFKTNALGKTHISVEKTYTKAIKQLKETLVLFDKKLKMSKVDFRKIVSVSCDVVLPQRFPRHDATEFSQQMAFANEMKIGLYFKSILEF